MELTSDLTTVERALVSKAVALNIPITGSIELLPLCNMNCDMCYVRLDRSEMEQKGKLRSAEEWIKTAEEMRDQGTLFLLLTGGEPLLYPDFKKLYCALKDLGMILTVNTNGTLIDQEWAEFFGKHKPRRINITLYGADEETYGRLCHYPSGFSKAVNGARLLQEQGVSVKFGCSAATENQEDIDRIIAVGKEMDIFTSVDTYMMPATRERDSEYSYDSRLAPEKAAEIRIRSLHTQMPEAEFHEYRQRILWETEHILPDEGPRQSACYAGRCSFAINWQGELRPCVIMTEPAMSVFEHGFRTSWEHVVSGIAEIRLCWKCSSCNLRPICRTCAACALLEGGSYDAVPDYMCRYAEESLRQLKFTGGTE